MTLLPLMLWQLAYIACCLIGMGAIFLQQRYRYRNAKGCRWWLYTLLAFGLAYDGDRGLQARPPAFPAGRWILLPS